MESFPACKAQIGLAVGKNHLVLRILQQIGLTTHILLANHRLVFDLFEISDLRRRPISLVDYSCYPSSICKAQIDLATHILG